MPHTNCIKAIKVGYRLFDGAYDYQNEREAGQGIKRAIDEGLVKREDIFVVTKLWNNYHRKEHALAQAKSQNQAWGLGYIDLYLIHFPIALKYVSPEKIRYPVCFRNEHDAEHTKRLTSYRHGGKTPSIQSSNSKTCLCAKHGKP
jgi:diketogulonate reductase-like aldo/keto reductase